MNEFMDEDVTLEVRTGLDSYHVASYATAAPTMAKIERVTSVFFDASGQSKVADATAYVPGSVSVSLGARLVVGSESFKVAWFKPEYLDGTPQFVQLKLQYAS